MGPSSYGAQEIELTAREGGGVSVDTMPSIGRRGTEEGAVSTRQEVDTHHWRCERRLL